ncbi:MAG: hypothetical protein M0P61_16100 [Ignavibacteriaceae bacterium]|nr:hypothetical protein [Ignavibacteriaceae bacterium]
MFLDLNIFELNKDSKSVISSIDGILKAIIPDNPNPYLLVIWSKQNDEYKTALEQHFMHHIPQKTPARILFLRKGNYFDFIDDKWQAQTDCIQRIEADLNGELENISLLRSLISWENIVHKKTSETINEFSSFYPIDENWDKNSKAIMYRLAKAIIGDDNITKYTDEQKLAKAFININSFLSDRIEDEVEDLNLGTITNVSDLDVDVPQSIISSINSKLHLYTKSFAANYFEQGNTYILADHDNLIQRILWDKKFKATQRKLLIDSSPQLIQLDITPVCDYSQSKEYVRTIFGVILNYAFYKHCENRGIFYYRTPGLKINNQEKFIFFDFRFIKTSLQSELIERNIAPSFKLRREICTDIQSQLANQINRPGISNL